MRIYHAIDGCCHPKGIPAIVTDWIGLYLANIKTTAVFDRHVKAKVWRQQMPIHHTNAVPSIDETGMIVLTGIVYSCLIQTAVVIGCLLAGGLKFRFCFRGELKFNIILRL